MLFIPQTQNIQTIYQDFVNYYDSKIEPDSAAYNKVEIRFKNVKSILESTTKSNRQRKNSSNAYIFVCILGTLFSSNFKLRLQKKKLTFFS